MKSRIFFVAAFILAIANCLTAQSYDFRKANWGMDSTQVKKAEKSKLVLSKQNCLIYNGKLGDWDTNIDYYFTRSNQLFHAAYFISIDSQNPQSFVNAFLLLQELLTINYKNPYNKKFSTINGKVITEDDWASNLISDNLNLETSWRTDKTDIVLSLFSLNDKLYLEINYTSIGSDNIIKEEQKKEILKDL
ncbi:MAG: hypothetical protein WA816_00930 [Bacteroidales bacterium]